MQCRRVEWGLDTPTFRQNNNREAGCYLLRCSWAMPMKRLSGSKCNRPPKEARTKRTWFAQGASNLLCHAGLRRIATRAPICGCDSPHTANAMVMHPYGQRSNARAPCTCLSRHKGLAASGPCP